MEQRRYPRIQLPLLVELKHPSLGAQRCIARDISEGGVFVYTENPQVKPGAKVRITVQNALSVEAQPTPTVEMEVTRVEGDGLALAFANVAGKHLWQSVERLRTELAIGRDYFQVHLSSLVVNDARSILLAQQHGKWTFPATFLSVGEDWRDTLSRFLAEEAGIEVREFGPLLAMSSVGHPEVPEAAVLDVFVEAHTAATQCKLRAGSRYRTLRWIDRRRDVEDSTFATPQIRQLAEAALLRLVQEETQP
jgi:ADP-ribose pyrophosphatase YjhB (NUDIX family)